MSHAHSEVSVEITETRVTIIAAIPWFRP